MKTKQQLQAAVDDLRAVCEKHGIVLIGTCASEGIFSEISIADDTLQGFEWIDAAAQVNNVVDEAPGGGFCVSGIGSCA